MSTSAARFAGFYSFVMLNPGLTPGATVYRPLCGLVERFIPG
ncbi:MAG: hypothetical protein ACXWID_04910 [Pyrinomonadaceae bacterium]